MTYEPLSDDFVRETNRRAQLLTDRSDLDNLGREYTTSYSSPPTYDIPLHQSSNLRPRASLSPTFPLNPSPGSGPSASPAAN